VVVTHTDTHSSGGVAPVCQHLVVVEPQKGSRRSRAVEVLRQCTATCGIGESEIVSYGLMAVRQCGGRGLLRLRGAAAVTVAVALGVD
jgi:hypothetical protein